MTSNGNLLVTPESVRPYPKYIRKNSVKEGTKKPGKTRILNSTPKKTQFKIRLINKMKKEKKRTKKKTCN